MLLYRKQNAAGIHMPAAFCFRQATSTRFFIVPVSPGRSAKLHFIGPTVLQSSFPLEFDEEQQLSSKQIPKIFSSLPSSLRRSRNSRVPILRQMQLHLMKHSVLLFCETLRSPLLPVFSLPFRLPDPCCAVSPHHARSPSPPWVQD